MYFSIYLVLYITYSRDRAVILIYRTYCIEMSLLHTIATTKYYLYALYETHLDILI